MARVNVLQRTLGCAGGSRPGLVSKTVRRGARLSWSALSTAFETAHLEQNLRSTEL